MNIHYCTLKNKTELNKLKDLINGVRFTSGDIDDFVYKYRKEIGNRLMTFEIKTLKSEQYDSYVIDTSEYVIYRYSKNYKKEIELGRLIITGVRKTFESKECNIPLKAHNKK